MKDADGQPCRHDSVMRSLMQFNRRTFEEYECTNALRHAGFSIYDTANVLGKLAGQD
jgi:hypothetical protein